MLDNITLSFLSLSSGTSNIATYIANSAKYLSPLKTYLKHKCAKVKSASEVTFYWLNKMLLEGLMALP